MIINFRDDYYHTLIPGSLFLHTFQIFHIPDLNQTAF